MTDAETSKTDPPPEVLPQRLGRNVGRYLGETIDIAAVQEDCVAAAIAHNWTVEHIPVPGSSHLLAFTRRATPNPAPPEPAAPTRIYLSAGIHGDEPAGPLAVRQLLREDRWPAGVDLWLCPCLNPAGFVLNRRENAAGRDLNREYRQPQADETAAHVAWLHRQPNFDLSLCLHEDWESNGFYVYELNPDGHLSLAEQIVEQVARICPIDRSEIIEGRPARNGVIRPSLDPRARPTWPEAFFLLTHKTRHSCTLEAPSDFPLPCRVAALTNAVATALALAPRLRD